MECKEVCIVTGMITSTPATRNRLRNLKQSSYTMCQPAYKQTITRDSCTSQQTNHLERVSITAPYHSAIHIPEPISTSHAALVAYRLIHLYMYMYTLYEATSTQLSVSLAGTSFLSGIRTHSVLYSSSRTQSDVLHSLAVHSGKWQLRVSMPFKSPKQLLLHLTLPSSKNE